SRGWRCGRTAPTPGARGASGRPAPRRTAPPCAGRRTRSSVGPRIVDLEVVELSRGPVAAEILRSRVGLTELEQPGKLLEVLAPHLLLDAVGPEPRHLAADVDMCLVDRVAEVLAGITAHDEHPLLRHEPADMAD